MDYDKWVTLEERWKTVERNNIIDPILAAEVCLVKKNYGVKRVQSVGLHQVHQARTLEHPSSVYYNKMAEMIHNDKMLIYFFQDSLTGSALRWYMGLNSSEINKWKDLAYAFLK
jgi:hypothetical protein